MPLRETQKKHLRRLAHRLHPFVTVGELGLSENVLKELETALDHHELVKVRLQEKDRAARRSLIEDMVRATRSELVMAVGRTASLYRHNPEHPRIQLPG